MERDCIEIAVNVMDSPTGQEKKWLDWIEETEMTETEGETKLRKRKG